MPKLGLGTWQIHDPDIIYKAIVDLGYRHLDTGHYYDNEEVIGEAIQKVVNQTDIKREDLFVTTKLWGNQKGDVDAAIKTSLRKLQLTYVDLYLIHFPVPFEHDENNKTRLIKIPIHKTWADMEAQVRAGLTKSIGVSNFNVQSLMDMMTYAEILPVTNEIELHPYLTQESLVKFCKKYDILPIGYCPLARSGDDGGIYSDENIEKICEKYNKTPAQICLRWGIDRGYPVIPKSSNVERLKQNFETLSFELEKEDVDRISDLNKDMRIVYGERLEFTLHDDIFA